MFREIIGNSPATQSRLEIASIIWCPNPTDLMTLADKALKQAGISWESIGRVHLVHSQQDDEEIWTARTEIARKVTQRRIWVSSHLVSALIGTNQSLLISNYQFSMVIEPTTPGAIVFKRPDYGITAYFDARVKEGPRPYLSDKGIISFVTDTDKTPIADAEEAVKYLICCPLHQLKEPSLCLWPEWRDEITIIIADEDPATLTPFFEAVSLPHNLVVLAQGPSAILIQT